MSNQQRKYCSSNTRLTICYKLFYVLTDLKSVNAMSLAWNICYLQQKSWCARVGTIVSGFIKKTPQVYKFSNYTELAWTRFFPTRLPSNNFPLLKRVTHTDCALNYQNSPPGSSLQAGGDLTSSILGGRHPHICSRWLQFCPQNFCHRNLSSVEGKNKQYNLLTLVILLFIKFS